MARAEKQSAHPFASVHPVAEAFPMMAEGELKDLASDIKANGQMLPIIVHDGVLIDGRNRLKACEIAGVEPRFEQLNGHDPLAYILSLNAARRHMQKGALAMVVAKAYPEQDQRGRGNKSAATARFPMVAPRRLQEARTVIAYAPDQVDLVIAGSTSLDQAYAKAQERKAEASSDTAKLERLRDAAPDLADLVVEERMKLDEAIAANEQREDDEKRKRELRTKALAEIVNIADYGDGTPQSWAEDMVDIDVSSWPNYADSKDFSIKLIQRVVKSLSCLIEIMENYDVKATKRRPVKTSSTQISKTRSKNSKKTR